MLCAHYAAEKRLEKWIMFLLFHKAQLGVRNKGLHTPLHCFYQGQFLSKYKRDFVHSILLVAVRNEVRNVHIQNYSTEELIEYFLERMHELLSMQAADGNKAMDIQESRTLSCLVDPDLVRHNFYDDAAIFCTQLKVEQMQDKASQNRQAQDLKQRRKSA